MAEEITSIEQLAERVKRNVNAFEDIDAAIDYIAARITRTEELNILRTKLSLMFEIVPGVGRTLSALIDNTIGEELRKMLGD